MNYSYRKWGPLWYRFERYKDDRVSLYLALGVGIVSVWLSTNTGVQLFLGRQPIDVVWPLPARDMVA